jgi:hypothetical protein
VCSIEDTFGRANSRLRSHNSRHAPQGSLPGQVSAPRGEPTIGVCPSCPCTYVGS